MHFSSTARHFVWAKAVTEAALGSCGSMCGRCVCGADDGGEDVDGGAHLALMKLAASLASRWVSPTEPSSPEKTM